MKVYKTSELQRQQNRVASERYRQEHKNDPKFIARIKLNNVKHNKDGRHRRYKFVSYLRFTYNLTVEEYAWMFYDQDGKCAICSKELNLDNQKTIHVDHDHKTGKVRGLLCSRCNSILGFAKDNKQILENTIEYLRRCS